MKAAALLLSQLLPPVEERVGEGWQGYGFGGDSALFSSMAMGHSGKGP